MQGRAGACPNTRPCLSGSYAMTELVRNVRNAQAPARPGARLEEDTVVAVLNTIHEIVSDSLDNARSLLQARGVPALVALCASRWVGAGSGGGPGAPGAGLDADPTTGRPQPIGARGEGRVPRAADCVELPRAAWFPAEGWLDQGALPGAACARFPLSLCHSGSPAGVPLTPTLSLFCSLL